MSNLDNLISQASHDPHGVCDPTEPWNIPLAPGEIDEKEAKAIIAAAQPVGGETVENQEKFDIIGDIFENQAEHPGRTRSTHRVWTNIHNTELKPGGACPEIPDYASISYKAIFCIMVVVGSAISAKQVFDLGDAMIFAMCFPNVLGLYFLAPEIKTDLSDYLARIKSGSIKRYKS